VTGAEQQKHAWQSLYWQMVGVSVRVRYGVRINNRVRGGLN